MCAPVRESRNLAHIFSCISVQLVHYLSKQKWVNKVNPCRFPNNCPTLYNLSEQQPGKTNPCNANKFLFSTMKSHMLTPSTTELSIADADEDSLQFPQFPQQQRTEQRSRSTAASRQEGHRPRPNLHAGLRPIREGHVEIRREAQLEEIHAAKVQSRQSPQ